MRRRKMLQATNFTCRSRKTPDFSDVLFHELHVFFQELKPEVTPVPNMDRKDLFMELATQYQGRLFGYIYALVQNIDDTQDLHQQTLMVLWRKFSQYQPGTNFMAWAARIAQIEVLNFRKTQPAGRVFFSDEVLHSVAESQLRQTSDPVTESRQRLLDACIDKLGMSDRELLDASYQHDCRIKSIAARLGRTSQSICNSLRRIRQELLRCVDRAVHAEDDL